MRTATYVFLVTQGLLCLDPAKRLTLGERAWSAATHHFR